MPAPSLREENRRVLLCGPLLFKPHEITGYTEAGQLIICLQDTEADRHRKRPTPPTLVRASYAEWLAAFTLTPKLREKLRPTLLRVAPELAA